MAPQERVGPERQSGLGEDAFFVTALVEIGLVRAGLLVGRAPLGLRHLPGPDGTEFGQHEWLGCTAIAEMFSDDQGTAVGIHAVDIDGGAAPVNVVDAFSVDEGRYRHRGMVRVEFLDHRGNVIDGFPDGRVVAVLETLHLVADAPQQQCRVVLVTQHSRAGPFELLSNLCRIVVVETVALMAEPDADSDGQAERVRLVQEFTNAVRRPRTNRVAARGRKLFQGRAAAGALDEVGLAAAQQLPALFGRFEFDWYGLGHDAPAKKQGPRQ